MFGFTDHRANPVKIKPETFASEIDYMAQEIYELRDENAHQRQLVYNSIRNALGILREYDDRVKHSGGQPLQSSYLNNIIKRLTSTLKSDLSEVLKIYAGKEDSNEGNSAGI